VIAPISDRLMQCIRTQCREDDRQLELKRKLVTGVPQFIFGIGPSHTSRSKWAAALVELNQMSQCHTPFQKVEALLATAKAIYRTYLHEHDGSGKSAPGDQTVSAPAKQLFLAADDFLPIFIYVMVNSEVENLVSVSEYLWTLR
jgi:hypothetical protein